MPARHGWCWMTTLTLTEGTVQTFVINDAATGGLEMYPIDEGV